MDDRIVKRRQERRRNFEFEQGNSRPGFHAALRQEKKQERATRRAVVRMKRIVRDNYVSLPVRNPELWKVKRDGRVVAREARMKRRAEIKAGKKKGR